MKKIVVLSLIAFLCLLLLGACVKTGPGETASAPGETSAQPTPTVVAAEPSAAASQGEAQAGATPGSVIIAESSNTISDSEKQEVLDSLMDEIDGVLGSIESLEDLDDSDLGTNDIE